MAVVTRESLQRARSEGYSDSDIAEHLAASDERIRGALGEGYGLEDIAGFMEKSRIGHVASSVAQTIQSGAGVALEGLPNIARQINEAILGGNDEQVQIERNTLIDSLARLDQREREGRLTPELQAARSELLQRVELLEQRGMEGRGLSDAITGAGQAIRKDAVTRYNPNPIYEQEFLAGTVPRVAGSAIGSVAPFLVNPGVGVANMLGQVFQDTYEENLEKGVPQDEAAQRALMNGIVSGGLESVSGGVVANIAKRLAGTSIRDMAPAALRSVVQGGVTEFLTGAAQETAGQIINEEQIDPAEIAKQGGLEALGSLFITGPAVGVGAITDRLARDRRPTITESEAAASLGVDPREIAPEPEAAPTPEPTEAQRVDSEIASLNSELERALQRRRLSNDDEVRSQAWTEAQAIDARLQEAESRRRNLGPGAANIEEMNQRRFVAAADILAGLQGAQQEPVGREQWERNFMRAYPELEGDTAALDASWEAAQPAAQQFAENEGRQPMPAVVAQQRGAPVGEGQTSLKNAVADEERRRRGLPPAMQAARQSNAAAWDEAMRVMDERPNAQADLIARQRANRMTPTDNVEQMILLHRTVELENAFDDSVDDINAAVQSGDTVALKAAKQRRSTAAAALTEVRDLIKSTGTSLGRSLQIRRAMMGRDYTLGRMVAEAQAAKESPLTEKELDQVETQFTKIKETEAALEAREEEVEQAASDKALDETVAEMEKAAPKEVDPKVKSIADRVIAYFEKRAVAARKRLRSKLQKVGSAPDPTIIVDLADMAAARIGKSAVSFSTWSAEMVQEFGEKVRQFLQDAWSLANSNIDKKVEGEAGPKRKAAVSRRVRKLDATEQRQALQTAMQERLNEGDSIGDLRAYVNRIAESFVASGVKERDAVLDSVMSVVQPLVPDITRRQLADLISGYGQFKQLDQAEIKREMRDIRGQLQQVSKLEDIEARRPPLKTGVQRREPSTEERRLIRLVNEAKKKYGVVVTDPARQLKSALDAVKTRLRNQIRDIAQQIETGEKPRPREALSYDQETETLIGLRDRLRQTLRDIEGRPEMTDAQRIQIATQAVERSIKEYEQRIKRGDISPIGRKSKTPRTPALEALRARRDALKAELNELRALANPKATPEERAIKAAKTRLSNRNAELRERMARQDFAKRDRAPVDLSRDPEAVRLKAENDRLKQDFERQKLLYERANQNARQKFLRIFRESLNLPRALLASIDLSAVLRQGGLISFGHPVRAARAVSSMFRAMASDRGADRVSAQIQSRPTSGLYGPAGLYLAETGDVALSKKEETIMSELADRIPGVKASNRAFVAFLNRMRADTFDAMVATLSPGGAPSLNEMKAIANYVNIATGRGDLGRFNSAAEALALAFFSPRLMASRFQYLTLQPIRKGVFSGENSNRVRIQIAKEYGRTLSGLAVILALGALAGADIEDDPLSSDFGKMRFGNTRIDFLAGLAQVTVLLSRLTEGKTKTISGKEYRIRGDVPFGQADSSDIIGRFLRTKLAPVPGSVLNVISGENVIGEPATVGTEARNLVTPLSMRDIYNVMQEQGVPRGTIMSILGLFGASVQNYETRREAPQKPE